MSEVYHFMHRSATALLFGVLSLVGAGCVRQGDAPVIAESQDVTAQDMPPPTAVAAARPQPDLSGRKRIGIASFYAQRFAGRQMADGAKMDPQGINAASRTLPLGTTAKVTNVRTGQSAVIVILDRGPYAKGRLVDLSPATARKIGITRDMGIVKVAGAPIAVPLPDGSIKSGVAAQDF